MVDINSGCNGAYIPLTSSFQKPRSSGPRLLQRALQVPLRARLATRQRAAKAQLGLEGGLLLLWELVHLWYGMVTTQREDNETWMALSGISACICWFSAVIVILLSFACVDGQTKLVQQWACPLQANALGF